MTKLQPDEARQLLRLCGIERGADYHALESSKVDALISAADAMRYRKPRNANGSRGRYFHAMLQRRATREA